MRYLLIILLMSGPAFAQVTELYRTVAADGTVTFSDLPLSDSSELISVGAQARARAAQATRPQTSSPVDAPAEQSPPVFDAQIAAQIAENCRLAEESLASTMLSDRLYRILPNGELEYLTAEEVEAARATAQGQVDEWCNRAGDQTTR
jgi:hypothetical protein